MITESAAEAVEEACKIGNLRLLSLSIAVKCRVTEIDIVDGKIGSCVGSGIGTLIGGSHPVIEDRCDVDLVEDMGMQGTYIGIIVLIAASMDEIVTKRMREKGMVEIRTVL